MSRTAGGSSIELGLVLGSAKRRGTVVSDAGKVVTVGVQAMVFVAGGETVGLSAGLVSVTTAQRAPWLARRVDQDVHAGRLIADEIYGVVNSTQKGRPAVYYSQAKPVVSESPTVCLEGA